MSFRDRVTGMRVLTLAGMTSLLLLAGCGTEVLRQGQPNFNTAILLPPEMATPSEGSDSKNLFPKNISTKCAPERLGKDDLSDCINEIKSSIDIAYNNYSIVLLHAVDYGNAGADIADLGFSTIATSPVSTVAKTVFSGLSAFVGGAKTTVNQDVLYKNTIPIVINQMNADRDQQYTLIIKELSAKNSTYTWAQAKNDLLIYFYAGTWDHAIASLQSKTAANQANCASQKANTKVAAAKGTQDDATATTTTGCPGQAQDTPKGGDASGSLTMVYTVTGKEAGLADLTKAIADQINDKTKQPDFAKANVSATQTGNVLALTFPTGVSYDWKASVSKGKGETITLASVDGSNPVKYALTLTGAKPAKDDVISITGMSNDTKTAPTAVTADTPKDKTDTPADTTTTDKPKAATQAPALKIAAASQDVTNSSVQIPAIGSFKLTISGGSGANYSAEITKDNVASTDIKALVNAGILTLMIGDAASGDYEVTVSDKTANYQAMVVIALPTQEIVLEDGINSFVNGGTLKVTAGIEKSLFVTGGKRTYTATLIDPNKTETKGLTSLSGNNLSLKFGKDAAPGDYQLTVTDSTPKTPLTLKATITVSAPPAAK